MLFNTDAYIKVNIVVVVCVYLKTQVLFVDIVTEQWLNSETVGGVPTHEIPIET